MTDSTQLVPPDPVESWPKGLALETSVIRQRGTPAFEGTGEPWSTARRFDGGVQMEWADVRFELTASKILVDAQHPVVAVDLYWNTLVATVLELRGITCLHGFMVEGPEGAGLAVLGNSGAGKTTTGRALLDLGCTLVCDDLVAIGAGARPVGRPFVRRLPEKDEQSVLDVGGKVREPQPLAATVPALSRALVLDEGASEGGARLSHMEAVDHLLRNPYVPMEISRESAERRLRTILEQIAVIDVIAAKPKSRTPGQFAGLLLSGAL